MSNRIAAALCLVCVLAGAPSSHGDTRAPKTSGRLVKVVVHSLGLEKNLLGDSPDQEVQVYLPRSYERSPERRYPTLYLLHGYTGRPGEWTDHGYGVHLIMDELTASEGVREMIIVVPNGRNAYLGSFYTNSAATGAWEDFIVKDVVGFVDAHYRTVPAAASRGIAGHSMGGYGALMLGMRHPDVFSSLYAMSPCCLDLVADLSASNESWRKVIALRDRGEVKPEPQTIEEFWVDALLATSAAFSPDPKHPPLFADFPYELRAGKLVPHEPAWSAWRTHLPVQLAETYRDNLRRLSAIELDYGFSDEFTHIPVAARALSSRLFELKIPHTLSVYVGTHGDHVRERLRTWVLPFFSRALAAP